MKPALPPLVLISDAARVGEDRFLDAAASAAAQGLTLVQVREPSWDDAEVRRLIVRLRERLAAEASVPPLTPVRIVLSRRPGGAGAFDPSASLGLAVDLDLAGVHVGGGDPEYVARARAAVGPERLVGYSAHAVGEILEAARWGADYVSFSPVFGAISKRHPLPPVGLEGLREACAASPVPVVALGGIVPEEVGEVRRAGAAGVAVIGAVLDAPDPGEAVRRILEEWGRAGG